MTRRETYIVERIDRRREHVGAKDARTARTQALRNVARVVMLDLLADYADDRETVLCAVLAEAAGHLTALTDGPRAASELCALAHAQCCDIGQVSVRQAAERLFAGEAA